MDSASSKSFSSFLQQMDSASPPAQAETLTFSNIALFAAITIGEKISDQEKALFFQKIPTNAPKRFDFWENIYFQFLKNDEQAGPWLAQSRQIQQTERQTSSQDEAKGEETASKDSLVLASKEISPDSLKDPKQEELTERGQSKVKRLSASDSPEMEKREDLADDDPVSEQSPAPSRSCL